jgi:hypothetical protein
VSNTLDFEARNQILYCDCRIPSCSGKRHINKQHHLPKPKVSFCTRKACNVENIFQTLLPSPARCLDETGNLINLSRTCRLHYQIALPLVYLAFHVTFFMPLHVGGFFRTLRNRPDLGAFFGVYNSRVIFIIQGSTSSLQMIWHRAVVVSH